MQVIETLLGAKQAGTSVRTPNREKQVMYKVKCKGSYSRERQFTWRWQAHVRGALTAPSTARSANPGQGCRGATAAVRCLAQPRRSLSRVLTKLVLQTRLLLLMPMLTLLSVPAWLPSTERKLLVQRVLRWDL